MKAVVQRVVRSVATPITLEEIDISTATDLEARYGLEIPVLLVDGKKAAKYRVSEEELTRLLRRRQGVRRCRAEGYGLKAPEPFSSLPALPPSALT